MITLLGATGYTGKLTARAITDLGLPLRLAGRDAARLEALSATLPGSPPTLVVDNSTPETLPELARDTELLISCAGPFTEIGMPVAALAARHALRYLDTTNELGFVHTLYRDLAPLAQASGATLVPACAFEVALADCASALLAKDLAPRPIDLISVTYALPGAGSSYGTRASALQSLGTSWLAYRNGAYVAARPAATTGSIRLDGRTLPTLSFPSSETATLPAHLPVGDVQTWMVVSNNGARWGPLLIPLAAPLLRGFVGRLLRRLSERVAPPPTAEVRAAMPFTIVVAAHAGTAQAALTLQGNDPYGLTAQIIAYAATQLLRHPPRPGVLPPALAFDPAAFLQAARGWAVDVS